MNHTVSNRFPVKVIPSGLIGLEAGSSFGENDLDLK